MQIKLKNVSVEIEEIRQALKDYPEILQEKTFEEEMVGKKYWYTQSNGTKDWAVWNNSEWGNNCLANNNVFFKEQDCDKQIQRNLALGRIMKFIRDNKIKLVKDEDWGNDNIEKYTISAFNHRDNEFYTCTNTILNQSQHNLAFYTEEDMKKVIDNNKSDLILLLKR